MCWNTWEKPHKLLNAQKEIQVTKKYLEQEMYSSPGKNTRTFIQYLMIGLETDVQEHIEWAECIYVFGNKHTHTCTCNNWLKKISGQVFKIEQWGENERVWMENMVGGIYVIIV